MDICVSDIIKMIESVAPLHLAEDWDNSGLQVGSRDWGVKKAVIALDPTESVVEYACSQDADMLITHHPLIFKALKTVDVSNPAGRIIQQAIEHRMAIYSAHTNFDSSGRGLNEMLASLLGLKEVDILCKPSVKDKCKLVFFVPTEQKNRLLKALQETTAGIIGDYTCCCFLSRGTGRFRPGAKAAPFTGEPGKTENSDEVRIETLVPCNEVKNIVAHLKKNHPYETMAYDIYPLLPGEATDGLGRTGILPEPVNLAVFAADVKKILGAGNVKFAGDPYMAVKKVALCTGSGSSLLNHFFSSGADVYLSGDLHYHDAMTVKEKGLGMIDAGHFATEIIMAGELGAILKEKAADLDMDVEFIVCPVEQDPFTVI